MSDTTSTEDLTTDLEAAPSATEPESTNSTDSAEGSIDTAASPSDAEQADAPEGEDGDDAVDAEDAEGADVAEADAPAKKGSRVRQLEREGEVAADFLETLLDIADLDGDLDVDVDGDRAAVAIVDSDEGRVPRRLVGPDGKVLEALQELTRLAVQVETGERSRLMLDIAGHRAQRRATLVELARVAIEDVKATGEKKSLEPMSAFERKVVHDEVAAAGLESESEGVDPKRHVVILPA
ncbi:spoIIIJ-associated protein [Humibacillus xanthopallidus]|uniref:SpoIIIJ-associated protein n=1 Tax=Humibacillus xanthopallidus TaxID=412689 RepID=A0A543PK60_9MICO|nr:R3H domain-containing nucleic acid-binding protein [Humibacillus xanthopallidus]TQN44471.1 spoIIIJ-associated protein [Humibacillus xanthopallidus]